MRKKRAVVYDDDLVIRSALKRFLELRGYEVIAGAEPVLCTIYRARTRCDNKLPCADILLTDNRMPGITGIELLKAQTNRGCPLTNRNKALISGGLDDRFRRQVTELGCMCFDKPVDFDHLKDWLAECEERMDLSRALGDQRRDPREACRSAVVCRAQAGSSVFTAEIVNRSPSGVCIKVDLPPAVQQIVDLESDHFCLSDRFLVRWTRSVSSGQYLVGMSCL